MADGDNEIKFNQNSIYRKIIETDNVIDISGVFICRKADTRKCHMKINLTENMRAGLLIIMAGEKLRRQTGEQLAEK